MYWLSFVDSESLIDAFRDTKLRKRSIDKSPSPPKELESPLGVIDHFDEILQDSGKKASTPEKEFSKSLRLEESPNNDSKSDLEDDNSGSVSLIRIKSNHNLNEEETPPDLKKSK